MSKKERSAGMADFMNADDQLPEVTAPMPATKPKASAAAKSAAVESPVKRGRGRPRKDEKPKVQVTTIRLGPNDHRRLRKLAIDDGIKMNELIFRALKEHCDERGVILQGN